MSLGRRRESVNVDGGVSIGDVVEGLLIFFNFLPIVVNKRMSRRVLKFVLLKEKLCI